MHFDNKCQRNTICAAYFVDKSYCGFQQDNFPFLKENRLNFFGNKLILLKGDNWKLLGE